MGFYAEGHSEAEEHSRRAAGASVQLGGLYDAIHVFISAMLCLFSCSVLCASLGDGVLKRIIDFVF